MLGAEGVKNAVLTRLKETVPTAIIAVSNRFQLAEGMIPLPKRYYPSAVPNVDFASTGSFPFVTVTVVNTDGELSSDMTNMYEIVEEYKLGYNVLISVYTMVSSQKDGEALARLQTERLVLAIREALLQDRDLNPPGDDTAAVNFGRWSEEYETNQNGTDGAWKAVADITVPIVTNEILDRMPYIADNLVYLVGQDVYGQDPVTGTEIEGSRQTRTYPEPDVI